MSRLKELNRRFRQSPAGRPWPRHWLVLVVALVAGIGGYSVAESQSTVDAQELAAAKATTPEEHWVTETQVSKTEPSAEVAPLLTELSARTVPGREPGTVPDLQVTGSYTNSYFGGSTLALPEGEYEIYMACSLLDPRAADLMTGGVMIDLTYGGPSPVSVNLELSCGNELELVDTLLLTQNSAIHGYGYLSLLPELETDYDGNVVDEAGEGVATDFAVVAFFAAV